MSQAAVGLRKINKFGNLESRIEQVRPSDGVLVELVAERRRQVEALQKNQADQLAATEARGQERLQSLRTSIGKDNARILQEIESKSKYVAVTRMDVTRRDFKGKDKLDAALEVSTYAKEPAKKADAGSGSADKGH